MAWLWQKTKWENLFETNFDFSSLMALTPLTGEPHVYTNAIMLRYNFYDHYLRRIDKYSDEKIDLKIGAAFVSNFNIRINPDLQNNGYGLESIANLMFAVKRTKDYSRKSAKEFKFLFFNKTLKPIERYLSYQLNVGILNFNYRPGYAYSSDAEINGSDTPLMGYALANHNWRMNGWRFGIRIEYTKFRPSGNGTKWAYVWDVASMPGGHDTFEMATHSIQYIIMINRK